MINKADLEQNIRTYRLEQLTDANDAIVTSAILEAENILSNALFGVGYLVTTIMAAQGTNRDQQLLGILRYITLYKIYERVPDEMVPERVVKNYDDAMDMIKRIADGRLNLNLPRQTAEDGTKKTKFRWGSTKKRDNI